MRNVLRPANVAKHKWTDEHGKRRGWTPLLRHAGAVPRRRRADVGTHRPVTAKLRQVLLSYRSTQSIRLCAGTLGEPNDR